MRALIPWTATTLGGPRARDEEEVGRPAEPRGVFERRFTGERVRVFQTAAQKRVAGQLEQCTSAARAGGCKVHTVLRVGTPHLGIVAAAWDAGADLVVLGTHGRGRLSRLLLGSVADRVVRMAPCSVLGVRDVSPEGREA